MDAAKDQQRMIVDIYQETDVIFGQGAHGNHHEGNIRWRQKARDSMTEYFELQRGEKRAFSLRIVKEFRNAGVLFLVKCEDKALAGKWMDIDDNVAATKLMQCMSDMRDLKTEQENEQDNQMAAEVERASDQSSTTSGQPRAELKRLTSNVITPPAQKRLSKGNDTQTDDHNPQPIPDENTESLTVQGRPQAISPENRATTDLSLTVQDLEQIERVLMQRPREGDHNPQPIPDENTESLTVQGRPQAISPENRATTEQSLTVQDLEQIERVLMQRPREGDSLNDISEVFRCINIGPNASVMSPDSFLARCPGEVSLRTLQTEIFKEIPDEQGGDVSLNTLTAGTVFV